MKKNLVIALTVLIVLALGFIIPFFMPALNSCTKKLCYPNEPNAEISCNSCTRTEFIFTLGFFHVLKSCSGTDILVYENSRHISEKDRVEIDESSCKTAINLLGLGYIP